MTIIGMLEKLTNNAIVGALIAFFVQRCYEKLRAARLKFKFEEEEPYFEPFDHSARVSVKVEHVKGELPAVNLVGF